MGRASTLVGGDLVNLQAEGEEVPPLRETLLFLVLTVHRISVLIVCTSCSLCIARR